MNKRVGHPQRVRLTALMTSIMLIVGMFFNIGFPVTADRESFASFKQMLESKLSSKGFEHDETQDGVRVGPYTRGRKSVTDKYAFYKNDKDDPPDKHQVIYVVEASEKNDQNFVIDGLQRLMATVEKLGTNQPKSAILKIKNHIIYYQLKEKEDEIITQALRSFFAVEDLNSYVISNYQNKRKTLDSLRENSVEVSPIHPAEEREKKGRLVLDESENFLVAVYHDTQGNPISLSHIYTVKYGFEGAPGGTMMCIDPFHVTEMNGLETVQGTGVIELQHAPLFERDPQLAINIQRYAVTGMFYVFTRQKTGLNPYHVYMSDEGYPYFAAMAQLMIEESLKTKLYHETIPNISSNMKIYSVPKGFPTYVAGADQIRALDLPAEMDLSKHRTDILNKLQEYETVPENGESARPSIKSGDQFIYPTGLKRHEMHLKNGHEALFDVDIQHDQVVITAKQDIPSSSSYTFEFGKLLAIPNSGIAGLLFLLGTCPGRIDTEVNNQVLNGFGTGPLATPPFQYTIRSGEEETPPPPPAVEGSVQITKRTPENSLLNGAAFRVERTDGGAFTSVEIVTGQTGHGEGIARVDNLPEGSYSITEIAAPEGYQTSGWHQSFTISNANPDNSFTYEVVNNPEPPAPPEVGSVKLLKVNDANPDQKLQGAIFELYRKGTPDVAIPNPNNGNRNEYITDAQGEIMVRDLPFGEYYFREVQAPEGYKFIPGQLYEFLINADAPDTGVPVWARNTVQAFGSVQITKRTPENNLLNGAAFRVERTDGGAFTSVEIVTGQTGHGEGIARVDNLPEGSYSITEIAAPEGYQTSGWHQSFTISNANPDNNFLYEVINNPEPPAPSEPQPPAPEPEVFGTADITKYVTVGPLLNGAVFRVERIDGGSFTHDMTTGQTGHGDGRAVVTGLPEGTYRLSEIQAPPGYVNSGFSAEFTVSRDNPNNYFQYTADNDPEPPTPSEPEPPAPEPEVFGMVDVYKFVTGGPPLDGAVFRVERIDGGTFTHDMTTGQTGHGSGAARADNLPEGRYRVSEISAPSGYVNSGWSEEFTVSRDNAENHFFYTVDNDPESPAPSEPEVPAPEPEVFGIVDIAKYVTDGPRLDGAVFRLERIDGGAFDPIDMITGQTGDMGSGYARVYNLPEGTYRISEIASPPGYQNSGFSAEFTVSRDNPENFFVFVVNNDPEPPAPETSEPEPEFFGMADIYKVSTDGEELNGAVFRVERIDGGAFTPVEITTGETGHGNAYARAENLPEGRYRISEIQAPPGYQNSGWSEEFTISRDNPDHHMNHPIYKVENAPESPGTSEPPPAPSEPAPSEPAPSEPAPSEPAPSEPAPSEPAPSEPAPSEPAPSEPAPSEPAPSEPAPDEFIGWVDIYKLSTDRKELNGAVFRIERIDGGAFDPVEITTGETGHGNAYARAENLPEGTYRITEIQAPPGYQNSGWSEEFTLSRENGQFYFTFHVENEPEPPAPSEPEPPAPSEPEPPVPSEPEPPQVGRVVLNKVDADDVGKTLQGAVFELYRKGTPDTPILNSGNGNKNEYITDAQGQIIVDNLEFGEYYFQEIQAPEGYAFTQGQQYEFIVNADTPQSGVVVLAKNMELPEEPPASSEEPPASSEEPPTSSEEPPTSSEEPPTSSEEPPTSSEEPSTPEPEEEPEIHKEVSEDTSINEDWGNHLDLSELTQTHYWNIQVPFGNKTHQFETVTIHDTFADILEVDQNEIMIRDRDGNQVDASRYRLRMDGQTLWIHLEPDQNGFGYLENQTYTVTVPTRIRADVTMEQLAKYVVINPLHPEDEGVPNEAELEIEFTIPREPGHYVSEKPTVIPPAPEEEPCAPSEPELEESSCAPSQPASSEPQSKEPSCAPSEGGPGPEESSCAPSPQTSDNGMQMIYVFGSVSTVMAAACITILVKRKKQRSKTDKNM